MTKTCKNTECEDIDRQFGPEDLVNPNKNECTLCTGNTYKNIFFVPRAPGYPGRCVLDEMTYEQVANVLQRIPGAKEDLLKITDDPILVELARNLKLVESDLDENSKMQKRLHENSLPMYTVLKGNIDGTPF